MLRVIIADDEENVLNLIKNIVDWESLGMEVAGLARNGGDALALIETLSPDLVVTDIRMPGCDGLELIERARSMKETLDFIIISGHRHFEYAQSAIRYGVYDYLLKPIKKDELTATLQKIAGRHAKRLERQSAADMETTRRKAEAARLRSGFMEDLLRETGSRPWPDINELNNSFHFGFKPGCFQAFVMKFDSPDQGGVEALCQRMAERLGRGLGPECYDMELLAQGNRVYGILNYGEGRLGRLRKGIKEAMDEAGETWRMKVTAGFGGVSNQPGRLAASVKEAGDALAERLVRGTGVIIDYTRKDDKPEPPIVKTAGAALDMAGAAAMLGTAFGVFMERPGVTGGQLLAFAGRVFAETLGAIRSASPLLDKLDGRVTAFYEASDRCSSAMELKRLLEEETAAAAAEALDILAQAEKKPVRQAKQYIHDHYGENVTLEDVAALAGFNAAYFSTLFKKESGVNFLEYLTAVRMDRARELLKTTDMTIPAVCAAVGYSDVKHFAVGFKKHTGLRPGEYRRMFA